MLKKEKKKEIIEKFKKSQNDTGSVTVQIALLDERIRELTEHCKRNPKDFISERGFLKLIARKKKLIQYLKKNNIEEYERIKDLI